MKNRVGRKRCGGKREEGKRNGRGEGEGGKAFKK